ncbi:MAG TPA: hypothetical protein VEZ90_15730 [Blastocatellia bacterium]|nr:hypothetical protein [Blastocatellia bacterium]
MDRLATRTLRHSAGGAAIASVAVMAVLLTSLNAACSRRGNQSIKGSASPSPGQCNNAYFPIAGDLTLQYRCNSSGGLPGYDLTVTFSDIGDSSFVRHEQSSAGVTIDNKWKCQPSGLMASDCNDLAAPQLRLRLKASSSSGVIIPSQTRWQKGTKWNYAYEVTGEMTFGGAPNPVEVSGVVSVSNEIMDQEKVTVPAGAFDTMKVVSRTIEHLSLKGGQTLPGDIVFTTTAWYAKDAGLVKLQSDDLKVTTELMSISRQAPAPEDQSADATLFLKATHLIGFINTHPAVINMANRLHSSRFAARYGCSALTV